MTEPLFISEPDWEGFADLATAKKLLIHARVRGLINASEADEVRFWAARGLAMRSGKRPAYYFVWLLNHPEAGLSCMDEESSLLEMKSGRRAKPPVDPNLDPVALADMAHKLKYPRKAKLENNNDD